MSALAAPAAWWRTVGLIARREVAAYFASLAGYVILAAHLLVSGLLFNVFAVGERARLSQEVLEQFFYFSSGMAMVTGILLAMRLVAGILFFFQGYDKVFHLKTSGVLVAFSDEFVRKKIPVSLARLGIALSSFIEMTAGVMLALGIYRDPVLYALAANMVFITLAFSYLKPMWDMSYFFPRFAILMALMFVPAELDLCCLSNLF